MRRVLLVGAGQVSAKHLAALDAVSGVTVVAVADSSSCIAVPSGIAYFVSWRSALTALSPDLVVVSVPPGTALTAARDAARAGATVLVEKPATITPATLTPQPGDERIFVAFQTHFAPGLAGLLVQPPKIERAEVRLAVQRDSGYFRGWRRTYETAGGVLHQQAIHGLALALRLLPGRVTTVDATAVHRRGLAETEDHITADIALAGGRTVHVDARVDYAGPPRHELVLHLADGPCLHVRGRNLEAGVGKPGATPTHGQLRRRMYAAVLDVSAGRPAHPCLFSLPALRRPLEVIDHVYRYATPIRTADAAAA